MNQDIENRLRQAAEHVDKAVEEFDGDAFSKRLFEKLGITRPDEEEPE